jgi:hypothetical protein
MLVTTIMASVYWSVRKKEKEATANFHRDGQRRRSTVDSAPAGEEMKKTEKNSPPKSSLRKEHEGDKTNGPLPLPHPNATTPGTTGDPTMLVPKGMMNLIGGSNSKDGTSKAFNSDDIKYVVETIEEYASAKHQSLELNQFGTQAVFQQFILYTLAFYVSYTFATINRIVEQATGKTYFGLLFMLVTLIPLQGLFNVLVYRYGYYFRLKQRYPKMTSWELFQYTWRWSFMGPPRSSRHESASVPPSNRTPTSPRAKSEITGAIDGPSSPCHREVADHQGSDGGSEIVDQNQVNISDDELLEETPAPVGNLMADMLYSYSEFPNMASGNDMVLVTTAFPTMVGQYFDRGFTPPPPLPTNEPPPSSFPTDFED